MIIRAAQNVALIAQARVIERSSPGVTAEVGDRDGPGQHEAVLKEGDQTAADAVVGARIGDGAGERAGQNGEADGKRCTGTA